MKKIIFLFIIIVSHFYLIAQSDVFYEAGHKIERYTERDGVMKSEIVGIIEDKKGFLWFVNLDYLLKYDGYSFKKYKPRKDQLLNGGANYMKELVEDKDGYIWISTFQDGGLMRFNPNTEVFERIRNEAEKEGPLISNVDSRGEIIMDKKGTLWLGSVYGLHQISTDGTESDIQTYQNKGISEPFVTYMDSVLQDSFATIEKIIKVRHSEIKQRPFKLNQTTTVLLISVGEEGGDYGWIEKETGEKIWTHQSTKHVHAGGAGKNIFQIDTIELTKGNYSLHYQSDHSHSFQNWNDAPPLVENWWGIQLLDAQQFDLPKIFSFFPSSPIKGLELLRTTRPFLDKKGNAFIVANNSIFKIELDKNDSLFVEKKQESLLGNLRKGIHTGPSGTTWIPTYSGSSSRDVNIDLYAFDAKKNLLKQIKFSLPENEFDSRRINPIINIEEDQSGNLWLGTWGTGLYKLSPPFYEVGDTINELNIQYIELDNSLGEGRYGFIRGLKIDTKNNLWIGSRTSHLFKLELQKSKVNYVNILKETELPEETTLSNIFEDKEGNVWVTAILNKGVIKYNPKTKQYIHYKEEFYGFKDKALSVLAQAEDGTLWLGGNKHLLNFNPRTEKLAVFPLPKTADFSENYITELIKDEQGIIWIRTQHGGGYFFSRETEKFTPFFKEVPQYTYKQVAAMVKDKDIGIWLMEMQGYGDLLHLSFNGDRIDTLYNYTINSSTRAITQDNKGDIWMANGLGLSHVDLERDTMLIYAEEDGLSNQIIDLETDEDDNIWVCTPLGISKFDKDIKKIKNYRELEGIDQAELYNSIFSKNEDGQFRVLDKKGFLTFHPDSIQKSNIVPTVLIHSINASGEVVPYNTNNQNKIELSYQQDDLSINYIGINFDEAPKQNYAYQLEGVNEDWVQAGKEKTARFPNVPAGTYIFKVKATNADGVWSEPTSLTVTILPPWWKTWWAYTFYILATIGSSLWYIQSLRKKVHQKQAQLDRELTLNNELTLINQANQRFVPQDILNLLGKESIKDLQLGDQVRTQMTVLFSDIRDYTPLSESMTPEENFKFINSYLGRVGPIIKAHGGFISTYLGDGLMALFVNDPANAIQATIAIQKELANYNQVRLKQNRRALKTGMGLNTGELMLGVIGDENRYESTVISDAVNTASRMEGLTKIFGAAIILSERTLDGLLDNFPLSSKSDKAEKLLDNRKLSSNRDFAYRYLGKVKVKGKDKALKIYDLYEGETVATRQLKAKTHLPFEQGTAHYYQRKFGKSAECFKQVLAANENDKAAQYYLDKSVGYIVNGVAEEWSGVEEMLMK